jgi:hypothetical protein
MRMAAGQTGHHQKFDALCVLLDMPGNSDSSSDLSSAPDRMRQIKILI